jgi:hypothetical protein
MSNFKFEYLKLSQNEESNLFSFKKYEKIENS